jgi:predicted dienelactone hydrolase
VSPRRLPIVVCVLVLAVGACASSASTAAPPTTTSTTTDAAGGDRTVTHVQLALEDPSRPAEDPVGERSAPTRNLATELYLPAARGPSPLVVFAHGFNGDPAKFTQLFGAWAEAGFAVLAPRFPVTYTTPGANPLARAADIAEQPADMSFVLDELLTGEYADRIDRNRIGVAGMSLGGGTTWALISDTCCVDRRFRAAIVMDGNRFGFGPATFVRNRVPLMVIHAKTDIALPYAAARVAYDQAAGPKYLVTIFNAVHPEPFEDIPHPADEMVQQATIAFWRAYLSGDTEARRRIVPTATVTGISDAEAVTGR